MLDTLGDRRVLGVLGLVVVVGLTVTGAAALGGAPTGEAVLNETRTQYATAESVVGTADVTVTNGSATATATVEFAVAGNRSRVVVAGERGTYRAGTNGSVAWYVGPDRAGVWALDAPRGAATPQRPPDGEARPVADGVRRPAAGGARPVAALDRRVAPSENLSVERLRDGSDDGTPAHVLRLTPADDSADGEATVWIAKDDARVLRIEATDGANSTVVDYRRTRFNVSVHESTFDPPSDRLALTTVDRYDAFAPAQADTTLDLPTLNATFREATVIERAAGTVVVQRYRADADNVTVVSTTVDRRFDADGNATRVALDGRDANVTTARDRTVVFWRAEGVTTAVIVDGDRDRAVDLARRVAG